MTHEDRMWNSLLESALTKNQTSGSLCSLLEAEIPSKSTEHSSDNQIWLKQLSMFVTDISNLLAVLEVADLSPQEQELLRNIQKKKNDLLEEIKVRFYILLSSQADCDNKVSRVCLLFSSVN